MAQFHYYSATEKNEIILFATMCMDLESIMLSEISQRKTNTLCYLYVQSKINKRMNIAEADSQLQRTS